MKQELECLIAQATEKLSPSGIRLGSNMELKMTDGYLEQGVGRAPGLYFLVEEAESCQRTLTLRHFRSETDMDMSVSVRNGVVEQVAGFGNNLTAESRDRAASYLFARFDQCERYFPRTNAGKIR